MAPAKFIGMLFQSRDMMHLMHLKTESFAEHKALNAYYDGILELTDSLTESYFGYYGRLDISIPQSTAEDAISHLKSLAKTIDAERENYPSCLQNILDEMSALVYKTLYLLTLT
jgi:hypothetical protein